MANAYATTDQLIGRLPSLANRDVSELADGLEAASRWIDTHCSRRFWLDPAVTDRYFAATDFFILDLGAFEIGDTTGVVVKTDDGTGTYATTVSASAYQLEPVNAAYSYVGARPYTSVRALSTSWPIAYTFGRQERIKITAKYGWPSVPPAVKDACLILAVDGFENPSGIRAEAIDGYSVSYTATAAGTAKWKLAAYQRPGLA